MIKFVSAIENSNGSLYGFGLTEVDLNRIEFNHEPIFFDFGYANQPQLYGLIVYLEELITPEFIYKPGVLEKLTEYSATFFQRDVSTETLRVFPIAKSILTKFRETPFWSFQTKVNVTTQNDVQLFFAGKDEQAIEKYLAKAGLITKSTKRTHKGFGKQ